MQIRSVRILLQMSCIAMPMAVAFAQTPGPRFDAAEIATSDQTRFEYMRGPFIHNGDGYDIWQARHASMLDLISTAYGVHGNVVLGGPGWLEMDRFDVTARAPQKASKKDLETMLQALLADRFHLVIQNDKAPMPAWTLTSGNHHGLKKSEAEGEGNCKYIDPPAGSQGPQPLHWQCHNMTMTRFADELADLGADRYLYDTPLVDRTGLEGEWDFEFHFTYIPGQGQSASEAVTIFDAMEKQLGLKLEAGKIPLPVIQVKSVDRKPTANPPGSAEALKMAPVTEFEVAEIKPSDPATKGLRFNIQPSGQVNISGATLKFMIEQLWQMFNDDMFVGAPKWWEDDRWDIVAKPPVNAVVHQPGRKDNQVDFDTVIVMLKALMAERFKLAAHMEDKEMTAYSLIAVKPKLKPADPNSRTRWTEGPATMDSKDPRNSTPVLGRLLTCQNMSMEEFGAKLKMLASGYIQSTVLDKTGLPGGYDFTLSFSTAGQLQDSVRAAASDGTDAAAPTGAVSLFEAVEKQMGLKLKAEKRPVPVLVIDHLEPKPTEN